ncbi:MAG: ThiF family adenylyltransferase [Pseudomonadota bacterium]
MPQHDDYFARVRPLLGEGLARMCIDVDDLSLCSKTIALLGSCMLGSVHVRDTQEVARWPLVERARSPSPGAALPRAIDVLKTALEWNNPQHAVHLDGDPASSIHLRGQRTAAGGTCAVHWDPEARRYTLLVPEKDTWSWHLASYLSALDLRDHLLKRRILPPGTRHLGHPSWPFAQSSAPVPSWWGPQLRTQTGHVMVVGLGSVGSEVLRTLSGAPLRFTLVDDGHVSAFNLVRQWFGAEEIGEHKVEALASRVGRDRCHAVPLALGQGNRVQLHQLLDEDRPDLVVLSTGTHDHSALAAELWRAKIPHVVACAYPQARFFELNLVDPVAGTPCLHCFRGRLFAGPASAPVVADELSRFLYRSVDDAERDRLYTDLVAEPASRIETSRIADLAALAAAELLLPRQLRSPWVERCFDEDTTCLLGGNTVATVDSGEVAYGISTPGQVIRLGLDDVVGSAEIQHCEVCGRTLETAHRLHWDEAAPGCVDEALLAAG